MPTKTNVDHAATENLRPYAVLLDRLRIAGLRPTRQRLALARLLFGEGEYRHITAEMLHEEAISNGIKVSLATVYNTLHQFTDAGLLKELVIEPSRTFFDTNTDPHHHFYFADSKRLIDVPADAVDFSVFPDLPKGATLKQVHVIITLTDDPEGPLAGRGRF